MAPFPPIIEKLQFLVFGWYFLEMFGHKEALKALRKIVQLAKHLVTMLFIHRSFF